MLLSSQLWFELGLNRVDRSKAFLLAADDKITDSTILSQLS